MRTSTATRPSLGELVLRVRSHSTGSCWHWDWTKKTTGHRLVSIIWSLGDVETGKDAVDAVDVYDIHVFIYVRSINPCRPSGRRLRDPASMLSIGHSMLPDSQDLLLLLCMHLTIKRQRK